MGPRTSKMGSRGLCEAILALQGAMRAVLMHPEGLFQTLRAPRGRPGTPRNHRVSINYLGKTAIRENRFFSFREEFFAFLAAAARRSKNGVFEDAIHSHTKQPNSKVSGSISEAPGRLVFVSRGGILAPASDKIYEFGPF